MTEHKEKIVDFLNKIGDRYEINEFSSGAIMIDVWHKDQFLVIQIDEKTIGLSIVEDSPSFDTRPDKYFYDFRSFYNEFIRLISGDSSGSVVFQM